MRCEICGRKIVGAPIRVKIESSVMDVCKECSKFGKIQSQRPLKRERKPKRAINRRIEPVYEVIEDYNNIIRRARENRGWSREDLATRINEKVSVIHRLEARKMEPDIKLAKKLEKILRIKILERAEEEEAHELKRVSFKSATIGDIARIKKH